MLGARLDGLAWSCIILSRAVRTATWNSATPSSPSCTLLILSTRTSIISEHQTIRPSSPRRIKEMTFCQLKVLLDAVRCSRIVRDSAGLAWRTVLIMYSESLYRTAVHHFWHPPATNTRHPLQHSIKNINKAKLRNYNTFSVKVGGC